MPRPDAWLTLSRNATGPLAWPVLPNPYSRSPATTKGGRRTRRTVRRRSRQRALGACVLSSSPIGVARWGDHRIGLTLVVSARAGISGFLGVLSKPRSAVPETQQITTAERNVTDCRVLRFQRRDESTRLPPTVPLPCCFSPSPPCRLWRLSVAAGRNAHRRDPANNTYCVYFHANPDRRAGSHADPDRRPDADVNPRRATHHQLGRDQRAARWFLRRPADLRPDRKPGLLLEPNRRRRLLLFIRRRHDWPAFGREQGGSRRHDDVDRWWEIVYAETLRQLADVSAGYWSRRSTRPAGLPTGPYNDDCHRVRRPRVSWAEPSG